MATIPQVRRLLFNDEEIGMGFDSESGLAIGTALEGFTVGDDDAAGGQEVSASLTIVNSHEELMSRLDMAFEAQGRYGLFTASAKAEFSESSNYNSTSTFLVAKCVVQNALKRGSAFRVRPPAQELFDPSALAPPIVEPAPIPLQRVMVTSAPSGVLVTIPDWHRMEEVQDLGFLDIVVFGVFETERPTGTIVSIIPLPGTRVEAAGTVLEVTVV